MNVVLAVVLSASVANAANAAPLPLTPVVATPDVVRSFGGTWRGHATSSDPRFDGDLEFRFGPGGAVVIAPHGVPAQILWVRLSPTGVHGALQPYFDASRGADVYTTFQATLHGPTLSGVLRERVGMRWVESATWSVQRVGDGR